MRSVKHKILVLSGKGGVGKSTVSAQLAFGLAAKGYQVGLLDVDICGPSAHKMFGLDGESVHRSTSGWSPVFVGDNLGVMSIAFMLPAPDAAVIWRGPRKNALIRQFLSDVDWDVLDFLIVDTPPGTSDEHITTVQALSACGVDGAVVVTTPQEVAMADVRKELNFCSKTSLRVLGVVENMTTSFLPVAETTFVSKSGEDKSNEVRAALVKAGLGDARIVADFFPPSNGGAEAMARVFKVPFLGRIPLDPALLACGETGKAYSAKSRTSSALSEVISGVVNAVRGGDGAGEETGGDAE